MPNEVSDVIALLLSSSGVSVGAVIAAVVWTLAAIHAWKAERRRGVVIARATTAATMVLIDIVLIVAYNVRPGADFFRLSIGAVLGFQIVSGMAAVLAFKKRKRLPIHVQQRQ
jgi:hypothetical protein